MSTLLCAEHIAHKLTGKAGRREGGGGADPRAGVGGHRPGGGLAHRRGLVRCEWRLCCVNADVAVRNVLLCLQGWAWAVACMVLSVLERVRGGRHAGVWGACCGAVWRLRGGGQAQVCRGEGSGRHVQWGCGIFSVEEESRRRVYTLSD